MLARFRQGDEQAAAEIYARYAHRLRALATKQVGADLAQRIDPDDIVQSVFRTFFRRVSAGQYDVPDRDELWQLLLVVGLNKIRAVGAHHRATKRDVGNTMAGESYRKAIEREAGPEDEAFQVLRMVIDDVLEPFPVDQRRIIELRIEGYEVAEIAEKTSRAKRSVERVLQGFRQALENVLRHEE